MCELNCHQVMYLVMYQAHVSSNFCCAFLVLLLHFRAFPNACQISIASSLSITVAVQKCSCSLNHQTLIKFWCSFMWYKYLYYSRDKFEFFNPSVDANSLYLKVENDMQTLNRNHFEIRSLSWNCLEENIRSCGCNVPYNSIFASGSLRK